MEIAIDRFSTLGGAVIVIGWSDAFSPGDEIVILDNGTPLQTIMLAVERPDLVPLFGEAAIGWGFRAYGISPGGDALASNIALRFAGGAEVMAGQVSPPPDDDPHALWAGFVAEVNATGGTVLELGARARSGNTLRDRFGDSVRYIGVDVTAGDNVDIVADVHHLSDVIHEPVDYVFSVSTFEHFLMPWKVALEINRVLRPGGKVFAHSHQTWPAHDEPWDYFRFSREAWGGLFNLHTGFRLIDARHGDAVSVTSRYNIGGPYDLMEHSLGWAMSVCIAEKVAEPLVRWDAPVSALQDIEYRH